MLSCSSASAGMMFDLVPACSDPIVSTTGSSPDTSRDTTVCSRSTVAAASTTGSTVVSGREPCPPCPNSRTVNESMPAIVVPAR